MIAISENLSKPCEVEVYGGGKSKEALMSAYVDVLAVLGKCESQRSKSFEAIKKVEEVFENNK